MKKLLLTFFAAGSILADAQVTWSEQAAQVFYDNCTFCHNPQGIGPVSFMDYSTAFSYAGLIQAYVENNLMPPWKADSSFQHYFQERLLTQSERDIILGWIADGAPEGNPAMAPPPPVYSGNQILPGVPDLTVQMPPYMSKATPTTDDYVCISIPSGLLGDKKIKAMEVIPGNHSIVHHCLVYKDPSASYPTDTIGGDCGGPSSGDLIGGYTPGSSPIIFPATGSFSSGMLLESGSNIIFAMHYPAGSYGQWDQTQVNFYFYDEPVLNFREIQAQPIIQDWSFTILANTTDSVEVTVGPLPFDYTVLSVFPHMHLIGTYIESYGLTATSDTIPFVRIPEWDFEWQDFYWFKYMQHVPAGSSIYGKGIWANIPGPHNPYDPPQNISAGLNTTDEMFLIYFHYMNYVPGDENVNIDSINTIYLGEPEEILSETTDWRVYPNPSSGLTHIGFELNSSVSVTIYIYNATGELVRKLIPGETLQGSQEILWDGKNDAGQSVSPGLYFYSANIGGEFLSGRIIRQ